MTADQVVDLHLEYIFKAAKAIKGISDFHCFEWQNEMIITKQYSCEVLTVTPNVITTSAQNTSSGGEVAAAEAMTRPTVSTVIGLQYTGVTMTTGLSVVLFRSRNSWCVKLEFIHQTCQNVNRFKTANDTDTVTQ